MPPRNSASSKKNQNSNPSSEKKDRKARKSQSLPQERKNIHITPYMKTIFSKDPKTNKYVCSICPGTPDMLKQNVFRHIMECEIHDNSIIAEKDVIGHESLRKAIQILIAKNREIYKKKDRSVDKRRAYLKLLAFCQSQRFSFSQMSGLGEYIQEITSDQRVALFQGDTFARGEISLSARAYGRCILDRLKEDLRQSPYSLIIDSSTMSRKNIVLLIVRYLKEVQYEKNKFRSKIVNRTIGLKYLSQSSKAKTLLEIVQKKLFDLGPEIKENMVGFIHDHASNLSGSHEGLGKLLAKELKKPLFDQKDLCHGLNLSLQKSLFTLPEELMEFIDEINLHFTNPHRLEHLHNLQLDNNIQVLSPKRYVRTRWLSLGESLARLVQLWKSLILYMKSKPKIIGLKASKYDEYLKKLESPIFKLQIKVLSALIAKINSTNITFQNQSLEIQHVKLESEKCLKELCSLFLCSNSIPSDFSKLDIEEWKDDKKYATNFLPSELFISNLITDIDYKLVKLKNFHVSEQEEKFTKVFQPFLAHIISKMITYFPIKDKVVNTLDFVNIQMEGPELKKKILTFNEELNIIPFSKINLLSQEIGSLIAENLTVFLIEAKKSSLYLWDLIQAASSGPKNQKSEAESEIKNEEATQPYQHLRKIFRIAHTLPCSSVSVEQKFSTLKLIRNDLRTRLHEETAQSLLMIHEEFQESNEISDQDLENVEKKKEEILLEISQKKKEAEAKFSAKDIEVKIELKKEDMSLDLMIENKKDSDQVENINSKKSSKKRGYENQQDDSGHELKKLKYEDDDENYLEPKDQSESEDIEGESDGSEEVVLMEEEDGFDNYTDLED